jgi:sarcosine oxidase
MVAAAHADVIIVGLGAMGSSTLLALARRGVSVLGIDRFSPPHANGSSHGDTRITRLAVAEGPEYAPFVKRSHELWRQLEDETGENLFLQCGGLVIGRPRKVQTGRMNSFVDERSKWRVNITSLTRY